MTTDTDTPPAPPAPPANPPAPQDPPYGGTWLRDPDTGVLSPAADAAATADITEN